MTTDRLLSVKLYNKTIIYCLTKTKENNIIPVTLDSNGLLVNVSKSQQH